MDYKIVIGRTAREVAIEPSETSDTEEYQVMIKGSNRGKLHIVVLRRENERIILSIDGKTYSILRVERTISGVSFLANGRRIFASIDGKEKNRNGPSLLATANELITSNFPAKIVKLVAKKGDIVREGETLVVLEAMKMEAQIKAPHDCLVEEVFVKEGDMVERGKPLVKLSFR